MGELKGIFVRTNGWGYHYDRATSWHILQGGQLIILGSEAQRSIAAFGAGMWFSVGLASDHAEDIENLNLQMENRRQMQAEVAKQQLAQPQTIGMNRGN